jgi:3-hydroxyacyl-CoA dehydrogenase
VTQRKDRFGGLHFFNPVPMMALVEVVMGKYITVYLNLDDVQTFADHTTK